MKSVVGCSFLLMSLVAGCGGGGGGGGGQCLAPGVACAIAAQCCSKQCDNGMCVGGGGGGDMATNNMSGDMAMMQNPNPDLSMPPNCQPVGGNCSKPADCCNGVACTNGKCMDAPQQKKFGESCDTDDECVTNACIGVQNVQGRYCSTTCTKTVDCTALSANPVYYCHVAGGGTNLCLRTCTKSAECTNIGPDWSCRQDKSLENQVKGFCGVYQNQPAGWPCLDNGQCAKNQCNTLWCADPCANDAACGQYGKCLFNNNQAYTCFPTCNVDNDCLIFGVGNQLTCKTATTRDGVMAKICSS